MKRCQTAHASSLPGICAIAPISFDSMINDCWLTCDISALSISVLTLDMVLWRSSIRYFITRHLRSQIRHWFRVDSLWCGWTWDTWYPDTWWISWAWFISVNLHWRGHCPSCPNSCHDNHIRAHLYMATLCTIFSYPILSFPFLPYICLSKISLTFPRSFGDMHQFLIFPVPFCCGS